MQNDFPQVQNSNIEITIFSFLLNCVIFEMGEIVCEIVFGLCILKHSLIIFIIGNTEIYPKRLIFGSAYLQLLQRVQV